jgi:hypothetical protein
MNGRDCVKWGRGRGIGMGEKRVSEWMAGRKREGWRERHKSGEVCNSLKTNP